MSKKLKCPECGARMTLRESSLFKDKKGNNTLWYQCTECPSRHGAHPDGSPLGFPADKKTQQARIRAHKVFDKLWKEMGMSRTGAYKYAGVLMGKRFI